MGGGGGGGPLRGEELRQLERTTREALTEAAQPKKRVIFISFASEDLAEVNLLRGQAKDEDSNLDFIDSSLKKPFDSKDAEYIRRGIRERIKHASVTICYVAEYTAKSEWVDWEVRESIKLGKGVIAMYKGTTPPTSLPAAIKELGITLVPWSQKEIAAAIERAARQRDFKE